MFVKFPETRLSTAKKAGSIKARHRTGDRTTWTNKMDKKMLDAAKHIEIMDFLEDLVTQHNGDITYMAVKV